MKPGTKRKLTSVLLNQDKEQGYTPPKNFSWQFGVFELKRRQYKFYTEKDRENESLNLSVDEHEQTLLYCRNFNEDEIKSIIIDQMRVNPIVYYEIQLNSSIDKIFEFNDVVIFYNIVIPGPA